MCVPRIKSIGIRHYASHCYGGWYGRFKKGMINVKISCINYGNLLTFFFLSV